jgi:hypothetical protein
VNKIKLLGVNCEGSMRLWRGPEVKISVFASRHFDTDDCRLVQWATGMGERHRCLVGTFHSKAEQRILNVALENGAFAVWLRGCSLPNSYSGPLWNAMAEDRMLVVSCFHMKHHTRDTARYCTHLAAMCCRRHTYFLKDDDSLLAPCCRKAISWKYDVQVFNEERRSEDFFIDL